MIELFECDKREFNRESSKGNQLKWQQDGFWYKADFMGYEGLSEVVVSKLLVFSSLKAEEYVTYDFEQIKYKQQIYNGAFSRDFRTDEWQLITLERLYQTIKGESLYKKIYQLPEPKSRLKFLTDEIISITGLNDFGIYLSKLLTLDALFLNEDRHMHNIALFTDTSGHYKLCPIFDNGAALLSDTRMEYPLNADVYELITCVKAKTISRDFDEQLDAAEELFGKNIKFCFNQTDVEEVVDAVSIYTNEERNRVKQILRLQMKKYGYLF